MDNIVVYHGALVCLGRFVAEAVGECFYRANNPNMSYASCVEGAKTDAISRCCKDLGIATDMWDANWREEWKEKYATSYQSKDRDVEAQDDVEAREPASNPHDLMAGAGGAAPPAATAKAETSSSSLATTATRKARRLRPVLRLRTRRAIPLTPARRPAPRRWRPSRAS